MKDLIIYYSLDGNTEYIANIISGITGADLLKISLDNSKIKPNGLSKYFWGGKMVVTNTIPEISYNKIIIDNYKNIFIGTPVWAWSYAPPIASFLKENKINGKDIALFICHGGGKGKVVEKLKEKLIGNNFLGEIDFKDPLKNQDIDYIKTANDWLLSIKNNNNQVN